MSCEPLLEPGKYSMFLLHIDGTWIRPTVEVEKPTTESELKEAVQHNYGYDYFLICEVEKGD